MLNPRQLLHEQTTSSQSISCAIHPPRCLKAGDWPWYPIPQKIQASCCADDGLMHEKDQQQFRLGKGLVRSMGLHENPALSLSGSVL
jgi:hypothetical protein